MDPTIERVVMDGMKFPLGVYPVEPMTPKQGYTLDFEPSDGSDEEGEWEEWPDRYVFDIVLSAERVEHLCRSLLTLFPGRVYPILDVIGHDAYREIDPYISYELIGLDRLMETTRQFRGFFFEDGMCGFGALSDSPFFYMFVDEHKIVTVRCLPELRERVESLLDAFDLEQCEDPAGADAAAHEHRSVLVSSRRKRGLLSCDGIVELLRDEWRLTLNVDPDSNVDDDGNELGVTGWRCVVRGLFDEGPSPRYAEVILHADSLRDAEDLAHDAALALPEPEGQTCVDLRVVSTDRTDPDQLKRVLAKAMARNQLASVAQEGDEIVSGSVRAAHWIG